MLNRKLNHTSFKIYVQPHPRRKHRCVQTQPRKNVSLAHLEVAEVGLGPTVGSNSQGALEVAGPVEGTLGRGPRLQGLEVRPVLAGPVADPARPVAVRVARCSG